VSCRLDHGCRPVRLPEHPDKPLWLVVVRGLGAAPMMLLTDLPMRRKRALLWWVVSAYLTRWRIEEAIRFVKQELWSSLVDGLRRLDPRHREQVLHRGTERLG